MWIIQQEVVSDDLCFMNFCLTSEFKVIRKRRGEVIVRSKFRLIVIKYRIRNTVMCYTNYVHPRESIQLCYFFKWR